ncbi:MAG: hypothetical protein AAGA22_05025, partial [Pseudomonadota bacterium]
MRDQAVETNSTSALPRSRLSLNDIREDDAQRQRSSTAGEAEPSRSSTGAPMVEGGKQAIVIGADAASLLAALELALRGIRPVLVENSGHHFAEGRHSFQGGFQQDPEDCALGFFSLSPRTTRILSRYGLSMIEKKLPTTYFSKKFGRLAAGNSLSTLADLKQSFPGDAEAESQDASGKNDDFRDALGANSRLTLEPLSRSEKKSFRRFLDTLQKMTAHSSKQNTLDSEIVQTKDESDKALQIRLASGSIASILSNDVSELELPSSWEMALQSILFTEALLFSATRPDMPFSASAILHRFSAKSFGSATSLCVPKGGIRSLTEALRRACLARGVDIRSRIEIDKILIENNRVQGVVLTDGGQIRSPVVLDMGR